MNIENTNKGKAIIYIRVSSDEQVDGTSLNFQESECRNYCQKKNLEVAEVFREEGESAKDLSLNNRRELLRAIEYCRKHKGQVQAFVVLRVNRFARNTEDHFFIRGKLTEYGVTLFSVTETIGNTPQQKVFETISAAFSEYDNSIRKQQCSDGMSEKINQGISPWKAPLGYACGNFKKQGLKKTAAEKPDPIRFPIIKQLFKTCLEQKIRGNVELAKLANQLGLTTLRGRKIYPQKIDDMFINKFYAGVILNKFTGKEIIGKHKPMLSEEEWNQVQLIRKGKFKTLAVKRLRSNPDFPLTRDILCPSCNIGLSGSHPRGNGGVYSYYHCHNKKCSMYGKNIPQSKLHEDFLKWLGNVTPKNEFLNLFKEIVIDVWRNNGAMLEDAIKLQDSEIKALKQKKLDYAEMMRKGSISEDFGKEVIEGIDNEIATKQITRNENLIDKMDVETATSYAVSFISDLPRQWTDMEVHTKKRFQKLILPEGISYDKKLGFGTAKLGLIYEMNQQLSVDKSCLVDPTGLEPATPSVQVRCSTR